MESAFQNNLVLRRRWLDLRQKAIALLTCVFVYLVIQRSRRRRITYTMSSEKRLKTIMSDVVDFIKKRIESNGHR